MSLERLFSMNGAPCACGKNHRFDVKILSGKGAVRQIPEGVRQLGGTKVFVLSDRHTQEAAGNLVFSLLREAGIPFSAYCFPQEHLEPDEQAVGSAIRWFGPV